MTNGTDDAPPWPKSAKPRVFDVTVTVRVTNVLATNHDQAIGRVGVKIFEAFGRAGDALITEIGSVERTE